MPESPANNTRVFISYSHDSPEHIDRVLALSDRLRSDGIDCIIDQYETSPPEGWARWCDRQIEEAEFVLVILTGTYEQRFRGTDLTEKGKGVKWEGLIITLQLYNSQGRNKKFIPIMFTQEDESHIPTFLQGFTYYIPVNEQGYESLYRHLTHQPLIEKPVLGKQKPMPLRSRLQELHKELWHVPPRNQFFTGRGQVIEKLHDALSCNGSVQVIRGLGGMGKTQTAVEYAYRFRNEYGSILWVRANSREALVSDLASLAQDAGIIDKNEKDQNLAASAAKRWLMNSSGWLLIFDNADDPELLVDFFPFNSKGHILLTSRGKKFTRLGIANQEELKKLSPDESKDFLLRRTGRSALPNEEIEALRKITKELDHLPLALEQAGAYISELECSFSDYLSSYNDRGLMLLQESSPETGEYPGYVATTWLLNFEQVERTSKASADMLRMSAFLDPDNIPLELITLRVSELGEAIPEALENIQTDPLVLDKLFLFLTRYSLITRDASEHTYSIHRLVQAVIRDRMKDDEKRMWAQRAVRAVNLAFPDVEFKNWHLCDRILPHALVCARFIDEWNFEFEEAARLLNQAGIYQYNRAKYQEAEQLYERSLAIHEKSLGSDHLNVATSLNNLAGLYYAQGRFDEAELLYERSLVIGEKSLGKDHPEVATSLNNLAGLYREQGRFDKAEPLYERSLAIREKSLGKDHPDMATSLDGLAGLYYEQGRFDKAEPLYERSLAIREKSMSKDHPDVAKSLNNLAELYREQGRFDEAEPLYEHSLAICEKSLGSDHPDVANSLNNLALLYYAQGRFDEAEPLYERSLAIREKSLDSDHPDVANSLNNLALLYYAQGRFDEAEPLYERSLAICKKKFGDKHPKTILVSQNLAELIRKMRG